MKTVALRFGITLFCILVLLVCFEFYLRQATPHIIRRELAHSGGIVEASPEFLVDYSSGRRRLVPNANVIIKNHFLSGQDIPISINSLGFRDDELEDKKEGEVRILVLGDSVTIGDYLEKEKVYVEVAENELQQKLPSQKVQLINAGIGNIGLREEIEILQEQGPQVNPDIVLLAFYLNDSRPPWGFSGEIGDRGWLRKRSLLFETIYRSWKQEQWVKRDGELRFAWIAEKDKLNWKENPADLQKLADLARYDWGAAWQQESWSSVEQEFKKLHDLQAQNGFQVGILIFPVSFQIDADYLFEAPQQQLLEKAQKFGFKAYDFLPFLREHKDKKLYYDQCHPTELGSELIGKQLTSTLHDWYFQ